MELKFSIQWSLGGMLMLGRFLKELAVSQFTPPLPPGGFFELARYAIGG